jgi:hypothetical protein
MFKSSLIVAIAFSIIFMSCSKDSENNTDEFVVGISYHFLDIINGPFYADNIVKLNLQDGKYENLISCLDYNGIESSSIQAKSNNKDLYFYRNGRIINVFNINTFEHYSFDFTDSLQLSIPISIEIDESSNTLYLLGLSDKEDGSVIFSLYPIDLNTFTLLPKIDFVNSEISLPVSIDYITTIDETNSLFFVKASKYTENYSDLYILNYQTKKIEKKEFNSKIEKVHFYDKYLFGWYWNDNNQLTFDFYSLNSNQIISQKTINGIDNILNQSSYFSKKTNIYWLGIYEGVDSMSMCQINLEKGEIIQKVHLSEPILRIK